MEYSTGLPGPQLYVSTHQLTPKSLYILKSSGELSLFQYCPCNFKQLKFFMKQNKTFCSSNRFKHFIQLLFQGLRSMNVLRGWVLFYLMHRVRDHSQTTFTTRGSYIGGPMMSTFCQCSHHRKCQCKGVGGQKKSKSCQLSLCIHKKPMRIFKIF